MLQPGDASVLANVAPGVFDRPLEPEWVAAFLNDPRHHIVVAVEAGQVIGFISAVHYVNPDKPAELWLNEVSVASTHQNRGAGRLMLEAMLNVGRNLNCASAWVLSDRANIAAMGLYRAAGGVEASTPQVLFEFELGPQPPDAA